MVKVRRANVVLRISEDEVNKYLANGFSIIDPETGEVLKENVPNDLVTLQKAYTERGNTIKQLKSELARLKSLNRQESDETPAPPKGDKETEDWGDDWDSAEEIEEKPKKGRKSKS